MKVFAIDPGTDKSAAVMFDSVSNEIEAAGIFSNADLLNDLRCFNQMSAEYPVVIEMIKSYGNVMGDSVLQTCVWIGRFSEACHLHRIEYIHRKGVVTQLCHNPRAKDSNVRQALIDRFSAGKGETVAIGKKGAEGPLYGVKKDMWAALAVAVAWCEIQKESAEKLERGLR